MSLFYRFCRAILRIYFFLFLPLSASGLENIPNDGAVILCGNHISLLDPPAIGALSRRPVCFMAKKELFSVKPFAALLKKLGAFPVDRKNSDMAALRLSIAILKRGDVLGIFPEGSRAKDGVQLKMESGVGFIALRARAAVVPVRIFGPYRTFRKTHIAFGAPVQLEDLHGLTDGDTLKEAMGRIESAIYALERVC